MGQTAFFRVGLVTTIKDERDEKRCQSLSVPIFQGRAIGLPESRLEAGLPA
jgi:hypothetical protein